MPLRSSQMVPGGAALIDAARAGDRQALGTLCDQQRQYLLLVAGQYVGRDLQSKVGASDIVQQSMLEAQRSIDQFRGDTQRQLRAWLAQIVRRNVVDQARRFHDTQRRDAAREVSWAVASESSLWAAGDTPSGLVRKAELDRELIDAIAQLPPRYQQVIEMRHREGLPYADIAQRFDVSVEATRQLWTRAVRQLQQILGTGHDGQRAPTD
jgi:RNA polymerase sigma-70 factor, ECF subfamily